MNSADAPGLQGRPREGEQSATGPDGLRRVAVLTHTGRDRAIASAARLIAGLSDAGIVAVLPAADLGEMGGALRHLRTEVLEPPPIDQTTRTFQPAALHEHRPPARQLGPSTPISACELLVVLGGDGTILRGAEWVLAADIALLGVNLGHVGFLAEAESSQIDDVVEHVVSCSYSVEERSTIEVRIREGQRKVWSSFAVNEVSVEKAARERMLEILVAVDGRPLSRWSCDGVVVSSPTGSTAYAFSAGGPVIWPGVDAVLLQPLSAHALFARPLVLGPDSVVAIQLLDSSATEGVAWCDGRRSTSLRAGMCVEVQTGRHRLRLARLSEAPFTDRLVRKFGLRVEGWRGAAEP